jgi:hypothetical protein
LTALLDDVDEPVVVAVDGDWGTGKSFFLRAWSGAHEKEFEGNSLIIYYDAFAKDFLQDPLVGLTIELASRFEESFVSDSRVKQLQNSVAKLARPALRVALAAGTSGVSELLGGAFGAASQAVGEISDDQLQKAWMAEVGRHEAVDDFRERLAELTKANGENRNLIFIVDELDRCRPDYAIELLETIKHFFNIPNVHFVLGVNLRELEEMVRTKYGHRSDTKGYLSKFITLTVSLDKSESDRSGRIIDTGTRYLEAQAEKMEADPEFTGILIRCLEVMGFRLSLRDADAILRIMALMPRDGTELRKFDVGHQIGICVLLATKVFRGDLYQAVLRGDPRREGILSLISTKEDADFYGGLKASAIDKVVSAFIRPRQHGEKTDYEGLFRYGEAPGKDAFYRLAVTHFETFRHYG